MLTDAKGNPIGDKNVQINISNRSANHNADRQALSKSRGSDIKFTSEEDMINKAETAFKTLIEKEHEEDLKNGFNVNDKNSIDSFNIDYTTIDTILVKFIKDEVKQGKIILLSATIEDKKAIVMVPPLYNDLYKKGDIITFKPSTVSRGGKAEFAFPMHVERKFNGVTFQEIAAENISGIMISREEARKRIEPPANA
jgi:hypothetical protein